MIPVEMSNDFPVISCGSLALELCRPGTFYRGTRFDWCGVFRSIEYDGETLSDLWFDGEDPLRHDNLSGCSEEYGPVRVDRNHCVKIGAGLLEVPEGLEAYDRFKLYRIADSGTFTVESDGRIAIFRHRLEGFYDYVKTVSCLDGNSFSIGHRLHWENGQQALTDCYNHNFFTFGKDFVDSSRSIILADIPNGSWREDSVNAYLSGNELHFERKMNPGEKCFIGNLQLPSQKDKPYSFSVRDSKLGVEVRSDVPMDHAVFWSNHRVACLEPYVSIPLKSGKDFNFNINYRIVPH